MTTSVADLRAGSLRDSRSASVRDRARVYFVSDTRRARTAVLTAAARDGYPVKWP